MKNLKHLDDKPISPIYRFVRWLVWRLSPVYTLRGEENLPEGFALTSLVDKAPRLKGRLLICQGMEDATVLPINSLSFIQSCVEHNVLADYFPYPCNEHNVTGKWREHLYLKFTDYFCTYL